MEWFLFAPDPDWLSPRGACAAGHDLADTPPQSLIRLIIVEAEGASDPAGWSAGEQLALTALHEAAHTVVSIALGNTVKHATIRLEPATDYSPGSLGHMCSWPFPPPVPEDCWPQSRWVEAWIMTYLAGYVLEDTLDDDLPVSGRAGAVHDHERVTSALHVLLAREPGHAADVIRDLRLRTLNLLSLPDHIELLMHVTHLLLCEITVQGESIHERLLKRRCGAMYPRDHRHRCAMPTHPYGPHLRFDGGDYKKRHEVFDGLMVPSSRERVSSLPGHVKRLRAIYAGGPGPRLTRRWQAVSEACNQFPPTVDPTDSNLGRAVDYLMTW